METLLGLRNKIENWLSDENYDFSQVNEPNHLFHFMINNVTELNMQIKIFQYKKSSNLIIGFVTFVSKEILFKIYNLDKDEKQKLKNDVNNFLSLISVDYRTGINVGYEVISDGGRYGAKYFIKTKSENFNKTHLLLILKIVQNTGIELDNFLHNQFNI